LIVLIVSSLLNRGMRLQDDDAGFSGGAAGLDALRCDTFFHLVTALKTDHGPAEPATTAVAQSEEQSG
jgi:hypothetical protein